jgi:hypothetical protein
MSNPNMQDRDEHNRQLVRENQVLRENDSASTGLLFGALLAGAIALGAGAYFLSQRPVAAPTQTIIERTKEVPAAQPKSPDVNVNVPKPDAPKVNITVPSPTQNTQPAPAAPSSVAPSPAAAPPSSDNSPSPNP